MVDTSNSTVIMAVQSLLNSDPDLAAYGSNALLIWSLSLYLGIDSIDEFATDSLTDGGNDKKIDLCYISEEEGLILIAQGYMAQNWGRPAAPANKASDLNTGIAWLLSANGDRIPTTIKSKALEARRLIEAGSIRRIELVFVHNCYESANIENELKTVADTTRDLAKALSTENTEQISVSFLELGLRTIEDLYKSRDSDILIDDWITVPGAEVHIKQSGPDWSAIVTSVPGSWINEMYTRHQDRLFSANFRDYMGAAKRKGNINYQIKQTAVSEPSSFWAYNNGVTAITHEIETTDDSVRIRGISIINGAQTSGALGETPLESTSQIAVLVRIVQAESKSFVSKVIQFNNTQNEIKPSDKRSSHPTQRRLERDLKALGLEYFHRRSTQRLPRGAITAASIATALCAFHGDVQTAYRNSKEIFANEEKFESVFRSTVAAEHVYLVHTLAISIDTYKRSLKDRIENGTATEVESDQYEILKYSPSKHFLIFVFGRIAEQIMKRRVSDLYEWKVKSKNISPQAKKVYTAWTETLEAVIPLLANLVKQQGDAYDVERSSERTKTVATTLALMLTSLESLYSPKFSTIRDVTSV